MEHGRAGDEQRGVRIRVVVGARRPLGERHVAGVLDESGELGNRDRSAIDREIADRDLADGTLLGVEAVRAHPERSRVDLDHLRTRHPEQS